MPEPKSFVAETDASGNGVPLPAGLIQAGYVAPPPLTAITLFIAILTLLLMGLPQVLIRYPLEGTLWTLAGVAVLALLTRNRRERLTRITAAGDSAILVSQNPVLAVHVRGVFPILFTDPTLGECTLEIRGLRAEVHVGDHPILVLREVWEDSRTELLRKRYPRSKQFWEVWHDPAVSEEALNRALFEAFRWARGALSGATNGNV